MYLIANGKNLDAGFPNLPPLSSTRPHPFTSHDVSEADWNGFLGDLQRAGTLAGTSQADTGGSGIATSLLGGRMPSNGKETVTESGTEFVIQLINIWNNQFFYRRRLEVILTRRHIRLDCRYHASVPSLNSQIEQMACLTRTSSGSSSSLISNDDNTSHGIPKRDKRSPRLAIHRAQKWREGVEKRSGSPIRRYGHTDKEKGKANGSGGDESFLLFVVYRFSNIHDCYGVSDYIS